MLFVLFRISHADMQVLVRKSETERGSSQRTYITTDNPSKPESKAHESPLQFMQTVTLPGIQPIYYMRITQVDLHTEKDLQARRDDIEKTSEPSLHDCIWPPKASQLYAASTRSTVTSTTCCSMALVMRIRDAFETQGWPKASKTKSMGWNKKLLKHESMQQG